MSNTPPPPPPPKDDLAVAFAKWFAALSRRTGGERKPGPFDPVPWRDGRK